MSAKKKTTDSTDSTDSPGEATGPSAKKKNKKRGDGTRETVESIAIAFVLAFLFKTFQAEAYVIPTGSMAPTLYGRHKEVTCDCCGFKFALGASSEVNQETGHVEQRIEKAYCSNCGKSISVRDAPVFNGDRILVNKQVSAFNRFDVVVFKNPEQGHVNYIKRLVGLPDETLRIRKGDLWVQKLGQDAFEIQRKKPSIQKDIQLTVYDDRYPPQRLLDAGWPERWEPAVAGTDDAAVGGWSVARNGWTADRTNRTYACVADNSGHQWLRYRNYFADRAVWKPLEELEEQLKEQLEEQIREQLEEQPEEQLEEQLEEYLREHLEEQLTEQLKTLDIEPQAALIADFCSFNANGRGFQGSTYWVGDLTLNATVEISDVREGAVLLLELVEGPSIFQCAIDLSSGEAELLSRSSADPKNVATVAKSMTALKGIGAWDVTFANVDDRLCLWVDGALVEFAGSTEYDGADIPQPTGKDLAPCGIAFLGAAATVSNLLLERDIYYRNDIIAFDPSDGLSASHVFSNNSHEEVPRTRVYDLQSQLHNPEAWAKIYAEESASQLSAYGAYGEYVLADDEYLMFGDNSSMSKDSRLFDFQSRPMNGIFSHRYAVREQDLIGKALFIFWPHGVPFLNDGKGIPVGYHSGKEAADPGEYPSIRVPFYPGFSRMKKIR